MKKIKATVHIMNEDNFPRQLTFEAANEEELYQKVFLFEAEHHPKIKIRQLCYHGKVIDWQPVYNGLHYCFGKGHISFEQFKQKFMAEPENIAV